jgi:hypothetical protein
MDVHDEPFSKRWNENPKAEITKQFSTAKLQQKAASHLRIGGLEKP